MTPFFLDRGAKTGITCNSRSQCGGELAVSRMEEILCSKPLRKLDGSTGQGERFNKDMNIIGYFVGLLKRMTSVLLAFRDILLAVSQLQRNLRSRFKCFLIYFNLLLVVSRFVSSAKLWIVEYLIELFKSLL